MHLHRLGAFLLILALLVGLSVHNVRAADMDCNMVTTSMDEMTMAGDCGGGSDGGLPAADCLLLCANASSVLPDLPATEMTMSASTAGACGTALAGRNIRPDPYPPRPDLLS
jgi:hypothetical protein